MNNNIFNTGSFRDYQPWNPYGDFAPQQVPKKDPPVQNIPNRTDLGREIRKGFESGKHVGGSVADKQLEDFKALFRSVATGKIVSEAKVLAVGFHKAVTLPGVTDPVRAYEATCHYSVKVVPEENGYGFSRVTGKQMEVTVVPASNISYVRATVSLP